MACTLRNLWTKGLIQIRLKNEIFRVFDFLGSMNKSKTGQNWKPL